MSENLRKSAGRDHVRDSPCSSKALQAEPEVLYGGGQEEVVEGTTQCLADEAA